MSKLLKFILKIFLLASLLATIYILVIFTITKKSDFNYNYSKFTHKGGSLIIGLSRAHYGISPYVIQKEFEDEIALPILNFAFEKNSSQYGDVMLKAIKQKIKKDTNFGLFILSVSPGSFSAINKELEEINEWDEQAVIGKMNNLNSDPNFEYFRNNFDGSLYTPLIFKNKNHLFHKNGWAEFNPHSINDTIVNKNIETRKRYIRKFYNKYISTETKSDYRIKKFIETIEFLKKHGQVILVRIPADKDLIETENKVYTEFDKMINTTAKDFNIPYFDYTKKEHKYRTYDGSHLFGESAIKFTEQLCEDIKKYQQQ